MVQRRAGRRGCGGRLRHYRLAARTPFPAPTTMPSTRRSGQRRRGAVGRDLEDRRRRQRGRQLQGCRPGPREETVRGCGQVCLSPTVDLAVVTLSGGDKRPALMIDTGGAEAFPRTKWLIHDRATCGLPAAWHGSGPPAAVSSRTTPGHDPDQRLLRARVARQAWVRQVHDAGAARLSCCHRPGLFRGGTRLTEVTERMRLLLASTKELSELNATGPSLRRTEKDDVSDARRGRRVCARSDPPWTQKETSRRPAGVQGTVTRFPRKSDVLLALDQRAIRTSDEVLSRTWRRSRTGPRPPSGVVEGGGLAGGAGHVHPALTMAGPAMAAVGAAAAHERYIRQAGVTVDAGTGRAAAEGAARVLMAWGQIESFFAAVVVAAMETSLDDPSTWSRMSSVTATRPALTESGLTEKEKQYDARRYSTGQFTSATFRCRPCGPGRFGLGTDRQRTFVATRICRHGRTPTMLRAAPRRRTRIYNRVERKRPLVFGPRVHRKSPKTGPGV